MNSDEFSHALKKAQYYCAYQERCTQEISTKLYLWGVAERYHQKIIDELITDNYLNEKRYATSFVRGKFNLNHWGKIKIKAALRHKNIAEEYITESLSYIEETDYKSTLMQLLEKKATGLKVNDPRIRKQKLAAYAYSKGFETNEIMHCIDLMEQ